VSTIPNNPDYEVAEVVHIFARISPNVVRLPPRLCRHSPASPRVVVPGSVCHCNKNRGLRFVEPLLCFWKNQAAGNCHVAWCNGRPTSRYQCAELGAMTAARPAGPFFLHSRNFRNFSSTLQHTAKSTLFYITGYNDQSDRARYQVRRVQPCLHLSSRPIIGPRKA